MASSYREMAMEILVFIVAWFAIGFGISTLIGAAASLGDSTKPVTRLSEIALEGVTGANAHFDATKVIGGAPDAQKASGILPIARGWFTLKKIMRWMNV
jgi:hypothetical protein